MIARLLIVLIRIYQRTLSPLLGNVCRFEPSCSRYAAACLAEHGALMGSLLSVKRLCKCHPFHPGGYDPPPLRASRATAASASPDASRGFLPAAELHPSPDGSVTGSAPD